MNQDNPAIGFIGLGNMGAPMCGHLLDRGFNLTACDLNPDRVESLASQGATAAESAGDVAANCDIVVTCVVSHALLALSQDVLLPGARPGQVFLDHSTIPAPESRRLHAAFKDRQADYIDAPISGGTGGAKRGSLRAFIGADGPRLARVKPIIDAYADPDQTFVHPQPGMGQAMKIVQQLTHRLLDAARLEVMSIGVNAGLDLDTTMGVIQGTNPEAGYARLHEAIANGQGDALGCLITEWPYYLQEADDQGIPMPMLRAMYDQCRDGEHVQTDGQSRTDPSVWRELVRERQP